MSTLSKVDVKGNHVDVTGNSVDVKGLFSRWSTITQLMLYPCQRQPLRFQRLVALKSRLAGVKSRLPGVKSRLPGVKSRLPGVWPVVPTSATANTTGPRRLCFCCLYDQMVARVG
eukprot:8948023-Pyramimonas_sp.AAC.1